MSTGTLPRDWVYANVVPGFKCDDRYVPSNYCPISLTSIVNKTPSLNGMDVHRKLRFMLIRHLFDPTLNILVQCGHFTLLIIMIC